MQPSRDNVDTVDLGLRPLTARSVVASTLLGMRRPELSGQLLVRSGELFGIAEGTTRTALSRMLSAGEVVAVDGRYRLAGHLLERQARQESSRRPALRDDWDGTWRTAIVTTGGRRAAADRAALRASMQRARHGELREGVWLRPDNLPSGDRPTIDGVTWLSSRPDDPGAIVARLWDVDAWAARAMRLRTAMAGVVDDLEAGEEDALAPAFEISAAVLRHLQADPLLPRALLPRRWPGADLRAEYDRYDVAFKAVWRSWFRRYRHG